MTDNIIITIGRQLGSGGHEIGKRLAEKLGIAFYDKELLSEAAKKSGINENLFEGMDEKPTNSLLYSLVMGAPSGKGLYYQYTDMLTSDKIFQIQSDVIKQIADEKSCVIVGRCADYILRDYPNLVKIFIHSDDTVRAEKLSKSSEISIKQATATITKADKKRANYYNFYTSKVWGATQSYHLSIDTSVISPDDCIDIIEAFVKAKTK